MSGAMREKDQADFDLERFVDMFDEAMTSRDPRVIHALRSLMMIVTLTRPEADNNPLADKNHGPLRRMLEDIHHLHRRIVRIEEDYHQIARHISEQRRYEDVRYDGNKYTLTAAEKNKVIMDQATIDRFTAIPPAAIKGLLNK